MKRPNELDEFVKELEALCKHDIYNAIHIRLVRAIYREFVRKRKNGR